jgi:hypothetical protein
MKWTTKGVYVMEILELIKIDLVRPLITKQGKNGNLFRQSGGKKY